MPTEDDISYVYNGDGLRVSKIVGEDTENYLYEHDKVVLETDDQNTAIAVNIYGLNLLQRETDGIKARYMYNGHGDMTVLLGASDTVLASYYYDAFGNITEETGTYDNPYRYAGYRYDEETKNYYLTARYYNPVIARFLQEDTYRGDPNDPLSLNLYTYCANNPVIYKDPSGHRHMTEGTSGKYGLKEFYQDQIAKYQAEAKKYEKKAERIETGLAIMNNTLLGIPVRQYNRTVALEQDPSLYNIADYVTFGAVNNVDRVIHSKPFSGENLLASLELFGRVTLVYETVNYSIGLYRALAQTGNITYGQTTDIIDDATLQVQGKDFLQTNRLLLNWLKMLKRLEE